MKDCLNEKPSSDERIMSLISEYGFIDGSHHKQWLLDQIVRVAMGCPLKTEQWKDSEGRMHDYTAIGENEKYNEWASGDEGHAAWDTGIAP